MADLARRHGHHPPTTLTDRNTDMTDQLICDSCNDPLADTEVGAMSAGVVLCHACTDDSEPADGAA